MERENKSRGINRRKDEDQLQLRCIQKAIFNPDIDRAFDLLLLHSLWTLWWPNRIYPKGFAYLALIFSVLDGDPYLSANYLIFLLGLQFYIDSRYYYINVVSLISFLLMKTDIWFRFSNSTVIFYKYISGFRLII